jgi:hypothetical protein
MDDVDERQPELVKPHPFLELRREWRESWLDVYSSMTIRCTVKA